MEALETWEKVLIGAFAVLILLWWFPGVKTLMRRSQEAPKDWPGVLIPLVLVVLFVVLLVALV